MPLTEEEQAVVHYLRESPRDALKKSAADLIEELQNCLDISNNGMRVQKFYIARIDFLDGVVVLHPLQGKEVDQGISCGDAVYVEVGK